MKTKKALFVLSLLLVSLFAAQVLGVSLKQACSPNEVTERGGGPGLGGVTASKGFSNDEKPFPPFGVIPLAPLPCDCGKYVTSLWVQTGEKSFDLIDCFRCPLHNDAIRYSRACEDCCPPH